MQIGKNRVVALNVELSDVWGNLIERTQDPVMYLHGGYGDIFPKVEQALEGLAEKSRVEVRLEPEDAFGDYDENLIRLEPAIRFQKGLQVGMRVELNEFGGSNSRIYNVTDIAEGQVILDGNHPLAGIALKFVATVAEVRHATEDEINNASADDTGSMILRALA